MLIGAVLLCLMHHWDDFGVIVCYFRVYIPELGLVSFSVNSHGTVGVVLKGCGLVMEVLNLFVHALLEKFQLVVVE